MNSYEKVAAEIRQIQQVNAQGRIVPADPTTNREDAVIFSDSSASSEEEKKPKTLGNFFKANRQNLT